MGRVAVGVCTSVIGLLVLEGEICSIYNRGFFHGKLMTGKVEQKSGQLNEQRRKMTEKAKKFK